MKKVRRVIATALCGCFVLSAAFVLGGCFGCGSSADVEVEGDVWHYVKLRGGKGGVDIVALKDPAAVMTEKKELFIPEKIEGIKVMALGHYYPAWGLFEGYPSYFFTPTEVEKIIIPAEVNIGWLFWNGRPPRVIESLSTTGELYSYNNMGGRMLIIPDGSRAAWQENKGGG